MTYAFNDEEDLGKVVKSVKPFCKLTSSMAVPEVRYIVGDFADPKFPGLAGKKWSRLCGFTFQSALNGQYFQFVYVPKLKGSLSRNHKALSGWYCWTLFSKDADNKQVTSINEMKTKFGFNVNKFVHSDLFDKYIKTFQQNVRLALAGPVQKLVDSTPPSSAEYKELIRFVNAVKDSIPKMDEVKQYVTPDNKYDDSGNPNYAKGSAPKVGHAKIAYNADKTYDLRNIDKNAQREEQKRRAVEKIAKQLSKQNQTEEPVEEPVEEPQPEQPKKKQFVKYDPSLKYKFGGGRTKKSDDEIFDKYDDYDNDDFR